jgi:hypothetical protein
MTPTEVEVAAIEVGHRHRRDEQVRVWLPSTGKRALRDV